MLESDQLGIGRFFSVTLPPISTLHLRGIEREIALDWRAVPHLPPPCLRALPHMPLQDLVSLQYCEEKPPSREEVVAVLKPILAKLGEATLPSMLMALADAHGIQRPSSVRMCLPRTQWASRSSSGSIQCSVILLFLPKALLEHVLLHELCHTEFMDHSPAFHARLERADPKAKIHAAALRHAERDYVPFWFREETPSE